MAAMTTLSLVQSADKGFVYGHDADAQSLNTMVAEICEWTSRAVKRAERYRQRSICAVNTSAIRPSRHASEIELRGNGHFHSSLPVLKRPYSIHGS